MNFHDRCTGIELYRHFCKLATLKPDWTAMHMTAGSGLRKLQAGPCHMDVHTFAVDVQAKTPVGYCPFWCVQAPKLQTAMPAGAPAWLHCRNNRNRKVLQHMLLQQGTDVTYFFLLCCAALCQVTLGGWRVQAFRGSLLLPYRTLSV